MKTIVPVIVTFVLAVALLSGAAAAAEIAKADPEAKLAYANPVWSPNGKAIAYVAIPYPEKPNTNTDTATGKSIHLATLTGAGWTSRLLVKDADWPVWSPDGKQLAFRQNGLAAVDIATGKITKLAASEDIGCCFPASWSPNGRYILCIPILPEGCRSFARDVRNNRNLGFSPGLDGIWLADGKLLSSMCAGPENSDSAWLRITDPTTGNFQAVLTGICVERPFVQKGAGYAWVWVRHDAPKGEGLYRVDLKTGVLGKEIGVRAEEVYWSPDGKRFAFLGKFAQKKGEEPLGYLYVGNTKNWEFKIAGRNAAMPTGSLHDRLRYAAWSPDGVSIAFVTADGDILLLKP